MGGHDTDYFNRFLRSCLGAGNGKEKEMTIDDLKQWVQEGKGRRSADLKIGNPGDTEYLKLWVYDYDLMIGQYITDMSEINLERKAQEQLKETMQRLEKMGVK